MKQSLSIKLGQQLTMTPQLQQAIRLLQLSTLDLQQEIQQALESNMMLEVEDDDIPAADAALEEGLHSAEMAQANGAASDDAVELDGQRDWDDAVPDDAPVESNWDDIYQQNSLTSTPGAEAPDLDSRNSASESLQDHLLWQLNLTHLSDRDQLMGAALIDAINSDGLLDTALEDLLACFEPELEVELDELVAVLKLIQRFDPTGVGARDIGECLLLQLEEQPAGMPGLGTARALLGQHLDLLGARDYAALKRKLKVDDAELQTAMQLIQTLNPRPAASIGDSDTEYVVPDVFVRKVKGRWQVQLNAEAAPRLRINTEYASLVRRADNSNDNNTLREHLQEARWFLKSLESRNETLLRVASKIVEHQRGFLEYGEEAMKPLVLHDIAEAVDMHESTISRVTTRKYMHTPRGIFELKYFFSSHVGTSTGGEVSSTAIRALIKKLTAEENPRKPLSDSKIAAILKEQNIEVARRTVAKYRELMAIPPSNERKRLL